MLSTLKGAVSLLASILREAIILVEEERLVGEPLREPLWEIEQGLKIFMNPLMSAYLNLLEKELSGLA